MNFSATDNRDDILKQLIELARFYVPEYNVSYGGGEIGMALLNVFADMFAETVALYNKMPDKTLIYYLNLMGARLLPSTPSEGYLTVKVNSGGGTFIKKGTRAYGTGTNGEKVIFTLLSDVYAIENSISAIFCKKGKNIIVKSYDKNDETDKAITLFDYYNSENLQERCIFLSAENILNTVGGANISLTVVNRERPFLEEKMAEILSDDVKWSAFYENRWEDINTTAAASNKIYLQTAAPILPAEVLGITGRWLKCELNTDKELYFTDILLSVNGGDLKPDCLYNNDQHLLDTNFAPFGEVFTRYDCFYIGCAEAFSKKSAFVTIEFTVSYPKTEHSEKPVEPKKWKPVFSSAELNEGMSVNIYVDEVVWEYWNGFGWVRLFSSANDVNSCYESCFRRGARETIKFICPADLEQCLIGGNENYFIRAKIVKHGEILLNQTYKYPILNGVSISYTCEGDGVRADRFFLRNNLETKEVFLGGAEVSTETMSDDKTVTPDSANAAYFAFDNIIRQGTFTIYFQNRISMENSPEIIFEYYGVLNDKKGWLPLKIIDETGNFSVSGIITFIMAGSLIKHRLFSIEKYWIRAVNTNSEHISGPCLKGIHINAVKIRQLQTKEPEYFLIEHGEKNKKCVLSAQGAVNVSVWVNEAAENKGTSSDEDWVMWQCVKSLNSCGPHDKVYIVDNDEGSVTFGNGKKGKIPPSGQNGTIRVIYSVCAGEEGNMDAYKISGFADSIPFIEKVYNPEPVIGGHFGEDKEGAIKRCETFLGRNDRIISENDCETFAAAADRNIVKVKAIISENSEVLIAVLPKFINCGFAHFQLLKRRILKQFEQSPFVLFKAGKIHVTEVKYIEYSVHIKVAIDPLTDYHEVYKETENRLANFFHPVYGNGGKGFEIGELPTKVQIVNYLNDIGIKIEKIFVNCTEKSEFNEKEIDYEKALLLPYAVPLSGAHEIEILI